MVKVIEKIKKNIATAQDRLPSYANNRHRPLEFEVGDKAFIKIVS